MNLKKGDTIRVIAGRDKGKQGTIEKVLREESRVIVGGINIRTKHLKASQARPKGGIIQMAAAFSRANVMPVCPSCSKPTRVRHSKGENGVPFRSCARCAGSLETI